MPKKKKKHVRQHHIKYGYKRENQKAITIVLSVYLYETQKETSEVVAKFWTVILCYSLPELKENYIYFG